MLERSLKRIEDSTLGQDSEEDFGGLFSDIDLASIIRKTKRFSIPERAVQYLKTKRTAETPPVRP